MSERAAPSWASLLGRRLLHGLMTMFLLTVLAFVLADLAPGDLVSQLELDPRISPQTIEHLRVQYGLDRPWPQRYVRWLASVAEGDFGYSLSYHLPVRQVVVPRLANSLLLTASATVLAWILGLLFGALAACRRDGWLDRLLLLVNGALLAVPNLLLALAALWLAASSGLFPVAGMASLDAADLTPWQRLTDRLWHWVLPASTLALGLLPTLAAHTRQGLIDALASPYVLAARAHGIAPRRILWRYALRGAANPLISLFGLSLGTLLSGSLIVEIVLGWPGLGPLLLNAVLARDTHVVLAGALLSAGCLGLGNGLADLLLWRSDPRLRRPFAIGPDVEVGP